MAEAQSEGAPRRGRTTGTLAVLFAVLLGLSLLFNFFLLFLILGGLAFGGRIASGDRIVERLLPFGGEGPGKVVVLPVRGLLIEGGLPGLAGSDLVASVRSMLSRAARDPAVRGVVLAIDSAGGAVTASDLLHHEIAEFRRGRAIPVSASLGDVAASGGYYVAVAAERIFAHATTITGSIGVVFARFDVTGLLEKVGIEDDAVVSAATPYKTLGSPTRRMSEAERRVVGGVVDEMYERFVRVVDEGRERLDDPQVRRLADGRIFTGVQAEREGLVDEVGYLEDAVEWVRRRADDAEAVAVAYERLPSLLEAVFFSRGESGAVGLRRFAGDRGARFLYLWEGAP